MAAPQFEELTLEKLETFLLRFADDRRTGQLKVQGEGAQAGRIDLHQGKIVNVYSPFASETIGEIARKLGFLSRADVQTAVDALSRSENAGKQLGEILLDEKLLTSDSLETCLGYQAESAMHSMLGFHGRISFLPGNVATASISLDPRAVIKRMRERDHVEEMGSAFLGITETEAAGEEAGAPEFDAQLEMRRLAQAVIRETALAAAAMQEDLDAQAAAAAQQLLADADLQPAELVADLEPIEASAEPDRPRLERVVLEICRPGASSTDALLSYAVHFGKRAILFAATSKGLKVAGSKAEEQTPFGKEVAGLLLPPETEEGAIGKTMEQRVPARGPFEFADDADRALGDAVEPVPEGDAILFPIALHERAIGMLYVDGIPPGDPGMLEGLAAAVACTAVVMENKLLVRTAGMKKKP